MAITRNAGALRTARSRRGKSRRQAVPGRVDWSSRRRCERQWLAATHRFADPSQLIVVALENAGARLRPSERCGYSVGSLAVLGSQSALECRRTRCAATAKPARCPHANLRYKKKRKNYVFAQKRNLKINKLSGRYGGGAGIRTLGRSPFTGFQDQRFRPLSHPSGCWRWAGLLRDDRAIAVRRVDWATID